MTEQGESTVVSKKEFNPVYTVDSFADGIAFGGQRLEAGMDPRDYFGLRLNDEGAVVRLRSRYLLHRNNPLHELEKQLMRLSKQGILGKSTIYLGASTDPFFPFEGKFDASMKFLQLFLRYTPGMLIVQTRSPLIVIAMPVFKKLGKHAAVTFGIETPLEESVERYTPGLPRISERLRAVTALRRFGIEVTLQVNPVLPYGDWKGDARGFAELLVEHGDFLHVSPLSDGDEAGERRIRGTVLAKKLAEDRKFQWLRLDSANPLISQLEQIAPEKLKLPERAHMAEKQMKIFAA